MLTSLATWPFVIQLHAGAAVFALLIGPFAIWRKRRDIWHRVAGLTWILLMLTVATSAWFIHGFQLIGPFSPIHAFSLITYWSLFQAIRHVRAGRYQAHGKEMRSLYLQALGIAGLFTLLPGRMMHEVLFGDQVVLSLAIMALIGVGLIMILRRTPRLEILR